MKESYINMCAALHRLAAVLMVCVCAFAVGLAQNPRLFTVQHGLTTSNFKSIYIDSKGIVWMTGTRMLTRFDGASFHDLPNVDKATGKPLFSICNGMKECGDEKYLVYTNDGLFMLDARYNKFERVVLNNDENLSHGYSVNNVCDYIKQGQVLVTTDGFSSYVYDMEKRAVDNVASQAIIKAVGSSFILCSAIDSHKMLWASTIDKKLACADLVKMRHVSLEVSDEAAAMLATATVYDMQECGGKMYFALSKGLLAYDRKSNRVYVVKGLHCSVKTLAKKRGGRLYVGTDSYGIWVLNPKDDTMHLYQNAASPVNMAYAKVADLVEDADGNLIVEIMQKGVLVVPMRNGMFKHLTVTPSDDASNVSCVTSMSFAADGSCWTGTDGGGMFRVSNEGSIRYNDGLRSSLVQSVLVDKHGTVWCGTYGGGVQMFSNGVWTLGDGAWLAPLANEMVMHLCYDDVHDVIYASTNGKGIFKIDASSRTVTAYHYKTLVNHWLVKSFMASDGTLWTCGCNRVTYHNAAARREGAFKFKGQEFFEMVDVKQMGDMIVLAGSEGVFFYDMKTGETTVVDASNGLRSNDVRSLVVAGNHVWVATMRGVASIDATTYEVRNYESFSGYFMGEFHRSASVLSPDGKVMFGGDNGILCFEPADIQQRKSDIGQLFFTRLQIGADDVDFSPESDVLDAAVMYATRIHLDASSNSFSISFCAPDVSDPDRIHYDYMLEGYDSHWHSDVKVAQASYASLHSGEYTLKVRAYYEDYPDKAIVKTMKVIVDAPWYASVWAVVAYLLVVVLVAIAFYRMVKERRAQKREIEEAKKAKDMRDAKLRMFTSFSHELKSPLMMIQAPLKGLAEEEKEEKKLELYAIMQRNCQKLLDIVKQITDIQNIDSGQFSLKLEEHDYVEYADRVFERFKGVAAVKNISFVVEHQEPELHMFFDDRHFDKIINNILSNAFKFTPDGGKVIARSAVVGGNVMLSFYNSGSRFDEEDMKHLYERFYRGSAGNNASGSGIGLNLAYELVKLHHGKIEVSNIEPDGVEFRLTFPFCNVELDKAEGKTTVLVVDDDKDVVEYVKSQLESDCNVLVAFSGNQAWSQLVEKKPDVVVTDYKMADGNGIDLCQRIKSNPQCDDIPVIMLTGEGSESLQLHSLNIQVDYYLEKPVGIRILRSAIAHVLKAREDARKRMRRMDIGAAVEGVSNGTQTVNFMERVNACVKTHLGDSEYSVIRLADDVGMSKSQLSRKMKDECGITPNAFIKSYRLKCAAYMLAHNNSNISEVMYSVGFSSPSYFAASFREYFNMSPREFMAYYKETADDDLLDKLLQ